MAADGSHGPPAESCSGLPIPVAGPASIQGVQSLASLIGGSWNHLMAWLQRVEELREYVPANREPGP